MKTSITSKALTWIGSTFVGTPSSMKMPEDFYVEPGDREQPESSEIYERLTQLQKHGTDHFRRGLTFGVGVLSSLATSAACLVLAGLLMISQPLAKAYASHRAAAAATEQAELMKQNVVDSQTLSRCFALGAEQRAADQSCVDAQERVDERRAARKGN